MVTRNRFFLLLVLSLAVISVMFKVPLASSQGLTIVAAAVADDLPINALDSDLWGQATAVEVPLSAQMIVRSMTRETNIKSISARALHNGEDIALLLEWADDTRNDATLGIDNFRDGVAIQFPLAEGQPFFCMGQQGGDVAIWHWKADWQAELIAQQNMRDVYPNMYVDMYPFTEVELDGESDILLAAYTDPTYLTAQAVGNLRAMPARVTPVENLLAGGFGSLTSQMSDQQVVQGHGEWNDGVWRVIFSRSLAAAGSEGASLEPDQLYSIAFAAWDGSNQERGSRKSTSQWISLELAPAVPAVAAAAAPAVPPASSGGRFRLPLWAAAFLLLLLSLIVAGSLVYYKLGPREAA
jgi:hypothetical protein